MGNLEKKTLTGLLGKNAGTKLYNWLNPCCDQFCQDVRNCVTPYKSYVALLTQTGTDAPVATVLENTLGVNVTFQYVGVGDYIALFSDTVFYSPNEYVVISGDGVDEGITAVPVFFTALEINSYTYGGGIGVPADDIIGGNAPCVLEIRKYN